jgi:hypothetical protein
MDKDSIDKILDQPVTRIWIRIVLTNPRSTRDKNMDKDSADKS